MLILTRKPGESFYIGDTVKVTIVEIKGHQIRVGIDAPKEVRIYREEIWLQISEENKKAAEAVTGAAAAGVEQGLESLSEAFRGQGGASALSSGTSSLIKRLEPSAGVSRSSEQPSESDKSGGPSVIVKRKRSKNTDE